MFDVELIGVSKSFGPVVAVEGVSLGVRRGEFLTLLGPSGCGKTTVLKMIAGLEVPTAGVVKICDEVVNDRPPYARDTSLMFQSYALFLHKTVFDNIAFGLKYRGVPRHERAQRVRDILQLVQLPGVEHRYPKQLSGGQQQRVALARALVVRPAVVLLDEPLSNLDQKLREEMRIELKQIQERAGITFVFVTHDQEEALTLSDRVAVMNRGKLLQLGVPREIYERPASRFVAEFIGRSNFFDGELVALDGAQATVRTETGLTLRVRLSDEPPAGPAVTVQVRAERVKVLTGQTSPAANALVAKVDRVVYEGGAVDYHVRLTTGEVMLATEPSTTSGGIDRGAEVWLTFDRDDCVVLPI